MDDILKQILAQIKAQGQELKELRQGQDTLIKRVGNLEQGQAELRQEQQAQSQEFKSVNQHLNRLEQGQTKLALHVEGELTEKIRSLHDDQKVIKDIVYRVEENQKSQDSRLNLHWQEIQVLRTKGGNFGDTWG